MRSFQGRYILSLKDLERNEFFRIFEVCDDLAPIARERNPPKLCRAVVSGHRSCCCTVQGSARLRCSPMLSRTGPW